MDDAKSAGAMALFDEKYGDEVRVLNIGNHSIELCGGTHVQRTGDIGLFKILFEGGVASGVRRIEAITGAAAYHALRDESLQLQRAASMVGAKPLELADKLQSTLDRLKQQDREIEALKAKAASAATSDLPSQAVDVNGSKVLAVRVEGMDAKTLRDLMDRLKQQLGESSAIVLASAVDGKVALVSTVSKDLQSKIKAGDLLSYVAKQINGKGGGRPDMAQGGGDDVPELLTVLQNVPNWIASRISG